MGSMEQKMKKPWQRWFLIIFSPIAIPVGFIFGLILGFRELYLIKKRARENESAEKIRLREFSIGEKSRTKVRIIPKK